MDDLANQTVIIDKLEAARRRLITAIHLYFADGDEVFTHTLTAAAFEILDDLVMTAPTPA